MWVVCKGGGRAENERGGGRYLCGLCVRVGEGRRMRGGGGGVSVWVVCKGRGKGGE